eukprot:g27701.t1
MVPKGWQPPNLEAMGMSKSPAALPGQPAQMDGSFDLTAIAQKLCHDRLRRLVLWEVLAVFLQSLVVLSLGLVLQELEFGLPTWLSLLGEAAEHPAWRSVPFALLIVLARFLQQVAKHRRVKIVEQALG